MSPADRFVRSMTADGSFRVIAATTTQTIQGVARAQSIDGTVAVKLGELITGAVLVREAMSPRHRVQVIVRDPGGGSFVADSHPEGWARGFITPGKASLVDLAGHATLTVSRTLANGELHQGVVAVEPGGGFSEALMRYMQSSEQIVTSIAVAATLDGRKIAQAGGYIVQLLPHAARDTVRDIADHLGELPPLSELLAARLSPSAMVAELLCDVEYDELDAGPLSFGCNCNRERVLTALLSLPNDDLREMAESTEPLEVLCDACGSAYVIEPTELG